MLSFCVGALDFVNYKEKYSVLVSATGKNPEDFTTVYTETLGSPYFTKVSVPLGNYYEDTIYVAFRHWGCSGQSALLLDSISMHEAEGTDLGIASIDYPHTGMLSGNESVTITLRNNGATSFSNFNLHLEADAVHVATETVTETIAGGFYSYTFANQVDLSAIGSHSIKVYLTAVPGDVYPGNDTISKEVINYGEGVTLRGCHLANNPRGIIRFNSSFPEMVTVEHSYTDSYYVAGEHVNGVMYLYSNRVGLPHNFVRLSTDDWSVISSTSMT